MSRTQRFSFLRKKATIRPVFHSSGTGGKVSPGSRRFSAPLRCTCDWVERDLTGCQIFLGSAGVIDFPVQFLPMYITLAFQERRGNSLTAIHRPYQGGLIIMISLHFPSLLVMRNESSFGEKEGECSGGGGGIFLLLLLIVEMRGETDGEQFTGGGMSGLFLKSALVPLLFFTSDGGEL